MKRHLNTLFITSPDTYIYKEGECIAVKKGDEKKLFPIHLFESIVCIGDITCSPHLLGFCSQRNVSISFISETGKFIARVSGPVHGNVLLRRQQYRMADEDDASMKIARNIVFAKICNSRAVINRAIRDHGSRSKDVEEALRTVSNRLKISAERVLKECDIDIIRGIEGEAARDYFSVFKHLIVAQKDAFVFNGRNRRPPRDRVNALLSYIYTILMHDVRSALETVGLDPAVGFLHRDRPGRYGLALDIMEEFRPFFADRLALSLINLKQVHPEGFDISESGEIAMDDDTRRTLLVAYQERKKQEIMHPFLKEKVTLGRFFFIQAMLLARHIRGDLDNYPPYIWR